MIQTSYFQFTLSFTAYDVFLNTIGPTLPFDFNPLHLALPNYTLAFKIAPHMSPYNAS